MKKGRVGNRGREAERNEERYGRWGRERVREVERNEERYGRCGRERVREKGLTHPIFETWLQYRLVHLETKMLRLRSQRTPSYIKHSS